MCDRTLPFQPPHCPNPACPFHRNSRDWHYKRAGFYSRNCKPHRIQRFLCLHCRRHFSTQTFSTTYWLKLPYLLPMLFHRSIGCSALRQIARELDVAPSTIMGQIERLGRHCLLFQQLHTPPVNEPLVIDGFESFEFSQYFPFHLNLAVGAHSHFFYAFTDAELRRKGRMTPKQKVRRAELECELGRADPKAIEKEVAALLRIVLPSGGPVEIRSDEHRAYPRAFQRVVGLQVRRHRVVSSKRRRNHWNPLFAVNLLDLLIRHSGANHKRETIAFSKRRQAAVERLAILQVWRNFMKSFSEQRRDGSPAERLGLREGKLRVEQLLKGRLFPSLVGLPERLMCYYRREIETRQIRNCRRHRLGYAF
jgi:transposase-like protein